jgi:hypothetical protein
MDKGKPRKISGNPACGSRSPVGTKQCWPLNSDYSCKGDSIYRNFIWWKKQRKSVHNTVLKSVSFTNWQALKKLQKNEFKIMAHYKFKICKYTAKADS